MATRKNLKEANVGSCRYINNKVALVGLDAEGRAKDAPSQERSAEDEAAVIRSDSCG